MNRKKCIIGLSMTLLITACLSVNAAEKQFTGSIKVDNFSDEEQYWEQITLDTSSAAKIAENYEDGRVESIELEVEDGYLVYSVEFHANKNNEEKELLIDPVTGDILLVEGH